ncbi:MAG: hypothetical protein HYZ28_04225 [Myxococcales bacterium]|nr:hypothetical protein [Myxococcales bacterium]
MRAVLAAILLLPAMALAQVPSKLGYQGLLLKADGTPEAGVQSIKFAIFATETGGTALWQETQQVALSDGFYATFLGEATAIPPGVFDGSERFLELSVGGTALTPRQRINSVAYALAANTARDVVGGTVDVSSMKVGGVTVIDNTGKLTGPAAYGAGPGVVLDGGVFSLPTSCASSDVLRWNGTSWGCSTAGSSSYQAGNGIALTGTVFSIDSTGCTGGQALKWDGTSWGCAADFNSTGDNLVAWVDVAATWNRVVGSGTVSVITTDHAEGDASFEFTVPGAGGATYTYGPSFAVAPSQSLQGRVWAKYVAGAGSFSAGVTAYDAAGNALGARWFIADSVSLLAGPWIEYVGTISGEGAATNQFPTGTRFVRPTVIVNAGNIGTTRVDGLQLFRNQRYQAGAGLSLSGDTLSLNSAGCTSGQLLKWNGTGWACQNDSSPVYGTQVGGGLSIDGSSNFSLLRTCGNGQLLKWDSASSAWACQSDTDTDTQYGVQAGSGLVKDASNNFSILRTCANGQLLKWDSATSAWACQNDTDTDTQYNVQAGGGLVRDASNNFSMLRTCANGQMLKWDSGTSAWACQADNDTTYGTQAGGGLVRDASNNFSLLRTCANGQLLKWDTVASAWACQGDLDSGGDITGVTAGVGITGGGAGPGNVTVSADTTYLATLGTAQTVTGVKTFNNGTVNLRNTGNTASTTLSAGGSTAAQTITFPDATGTAITTGNLGNITGTGVVSVGTWQAGIIGPAYGGTGLNTAAAGGGSLLRRNVAGTLWETVAAGGAGEVLKMSGGVPTWLADNDTTYGVVPAGGLTINASNQFAVDATITATLAGAQTFTGTKSYNDGTLLLRNSGGTFTTALSAGASTAARTITFPDVTGTAITTSNLTAITATGTIASGTWNGTAIGAAYGGTGIDTSAATGGSILHRNSAGTAWTTLAAGFNGSILRMAGGVPTWGTDPSFVNQQLPQTNTLSAPDATFTVGSYPSVAIGADGLPVISYYYGSGADLRVLKCGTPDCATASANTISNVDTTVAVGGYTSIAIGTDGYPVVAYYDFSNGDLKVAKCGNAACSSGNTITTIDTLNVTGQYTSIAIGTDGLPVIAYADATTWDLKVAKCGNTSCSAGNIITVLDAGNVGINGNSITIGTDGLPVISYYDWGLGDLKVAKCSSTACLAATITTVDSALFVGQYSSINIAADGLPIISYNDQTNLELRVAKCGNAACNAGNTFIGIDSGVTNVGWYSSLTIPADGLPLISYYDATNGDLKVARCSTFGCTGGGVNVVAVDVSNNVGQWTSVTTGSDGLPIIAHYDSTNFDLRVAKCANSFCLNNWSRR